MTYIIPPSAFLTDSQ